MEDEEKKKKKSKDEDHSLPTLTLDPPTQEKSNYRCKYDPALDTSLVKKSAGPLWVSFHSTSIGTQNQHCSSNQTQTETHDSNWPTPLHYLLIQPPLLVVQPSSPAYPAHPVPGRPSTRESN
ncbi:hypothetical protein PGTUg99_011356 [Puccinia graminis f. sp. tritici]|uniref:Uncharacterized protein n=1 Tax=Puccinia graminis f. sp. tritici TaxID=56615 RepID=A0A5B0R572_PUCGR|nr:hypothetical protein PGTUg99_011356 [Puccinia graminis f. sp. tritici]